MIKILYNKIGNADNDDLLWKSNIIEAYNKFSQHIEYKEPIEYPKIEPKKVPIVKEKKSGNIINIASTAATKGFAHGSVYAASKFALRGLTQCWQAELRKFNIRVSLVNPSEVATAFAATDRKEREEASNKLGPKEIADTIVSVVELRDRLKEAQV